jgi:hypothetical protein
MFCMWPVGILPKHIGSVRKIAINSYRCAVKAALAMRSVTVFARVVQLQTSKSGPQMMFNLIYVSQETGESLHRIQQCNKLRARNQCNNELKLQASWPRIQDQCRNIRTWKDGQEPDSVIIIFITQVTTICNIQTQTSPSCQHFCIRQLGQEMCIFLPMYRK